MCCRWITAAAPRPLVSRRGTAGSRQRDFAQGRNRSFLVVYRQWWLISWPSATSDVTGWHRLWGKPVWIDLWPWTASLKEEINDTINILQLKLNWNVLCVVLKIKRNLWRMILMMIINSQSVKLLCLLHVCSVLSQSGAKHPDFFAIVIIVFIFNLFWSHFPQTPNQSNSSNSHG